MNRISYWYVLTRRKNFVEEDTDGNDSGKLKRVLGLYDLIVLGVGSTLGAGIYVLAGQIAKEVAGPSVIISFMIAALTTLLAVVCYAELGARIPKAGSAYIYSYICVGEFAAFVIGWNLILEYMIGTASVCRSISLYLDTLINDTLKVTFAEVAPININFLATYVDFFAGALVLIVAGECNLNAEQTMKLDDSIPFTTYPQTDKFYDERVFYFIESDALKAENILILKAEHFFAVIMIFGAKVLVLANKFCTCLNLFILLFVIIAGSFKVDFSNWSVVVEKLNKSSNSVESNMYKLGTGGFFPFGFVGTLKGAATCFFGFVGFDIIATTGAEVHNPRQTIPRAFTLSLLIIFLCYFGVSTVVTLMVPYYLQDINAPLPSAFRAVGWSFAMQFISVGGSLALLASLVGALFPLPRIIFAMAQDGLLFRRLGKMHPILNVPLMGFATAAILTAIIAGLFELSQLVNLLSLGTLLSYTMVAISLIILRYSDNSNLHKTDLDLQLRGNRCLGNEKQQCNGVTDGILEIYETSTLLDTRQRFACTAFLKQLFNIKSRQIPNQLTTRTIALLIILFCILSLGIDFMLMKLMFNQNVWLLMLFATLILLTFLILLGMCAQPQNLAVDRTLFRAPLVPLVPAFSIFINIYLMLQLDALTWLRFIIWMILGLIIYFSYGLPNSYQNVIRQSKGWCKTKYTGCTKVYGSMDAI